MVSGMFPARDPATVEMLPPPPRLHWVLVLLLEIVTLGYFGLFWLYMQARWVRKMRGRSRTMRWLIAVVVLYPAVFIALILVLIVLTVVHVPIDRSASTLVDGFAEIVVVILRLTAVYTLRNELAEPPINLATSKVMALFFGQLYFQYFLRKFRFEEGVMADSTLESPSQL